MLERWEDVAIRLEVTNDFPGRRGLNSRFRTRKELLLMVQSEIRRENQLRLVVSPIIYVLFASQVVEDFLHQQYLPELLGYPTSHVLPSPFRTATEDWHH